jgi:hypothetical protein
MFCFIFLTIFLACYAIYVYNYKYNALSQASYVIEQPIRLASLRFSSSEEFGLIKATLSIWNILTLSIKLNYTMPSVVISNGPVAQPGRVPDFYPMKEIRLSRVRIPTGPHQTCRFIRAHIPNLGRSKVCNLSVQ